MAEEDVTSGPKSSLFTRLKASMISNGIQDSYKPDIVGPDVKTKSATPDPNSFHRAMSHVLVIAQCFAILPVEGVTGSDATALRFRWCTLRVVYTLLSVVGTSFMIYAHFIYISENKGPASISGTTDCVYGVINGLALLLFLQLAIKWPNLLMKIQHFESEMSPNYGFPKTLVKEFKLLTSIILVSSLVEHVLSNVKVINWSLECADWSKDWVVIFLKNTYPIAVTVQFSYFKALLMRLTQNVNVFTWNFMDLLIILFSRFLTSRVRQLNMRVNSVKNKVMPKLFWRRIREDYNDLSVLVKLVDDHIGKIVLLSFANNVFFICIQLLNSIQNDMSKEDYMYFYVSFTHLLLRSTAMCLFAASIHEESKAPKSVLFSIPSESFSQEVQRMIHQVSKDDMTLTGVNFFSITKTLLLTLAGTIVTYEIVLVQLNNTTHNTDDNLMNATLTINPFCPNRTVT